MKHIKTLKSSCKLQFLLGLFLLWSHLNAQKKVDQFFLDSIQELNIKAYQLTNKNLDSAFVMSTQLMEDLGVNEGVVDFNALSYFPIDTLVLSDIYSARANQYFSKGEYYKALRCNLNALQLRRLINDTIKIAGSLNNIGNIFYLKGGSKNSENYTKSISYYSQSYTLLKESRSPLCKQLLPLNGLGLVYRAQGIENEAKKYFEKGLKILEGCPNSKGMKAQLYGNLGELLFEQGAKEVAIGYLREGIALNSELGRTKSLAWCYAVLGNIYLEEEEYDEASLLLNKADSAAKESSTFEIKKDIEGFFLRYDMRRNDLGGLAICFSNYEELVDSLSENKSNQNIQDAETKYEVEKKEAALALSREKEARAREESRANRLYLIIAIIGLVVIVGAYGLSYRNHQQKRKIALYELQFQEQEIKKLQANQESEALSAMLKGQEEERERIAKDLHDQLGGTLAALKMSLRKEGSQVDSEDIEAVDQAVVEVRNIAHNLSSGLLEKQGLGVALQELKKSIERAGKIKFNLFLQSGLSEIGQEAAIELYRIVQELTNNTLKHSQAKEISLQTNVNEESFNLIFEDDGVGFDKNKQIRGMGMRNIAARVKKINGTFHLDSQKGRGTIAIIELERKA